MRRLLILLLLLPLPAAALTIEQATTWRGEMRFTERCGSPRAPC